MTFDFVNGIKGHLNVSHKGYHLLIDQFYPIHNTRNHLTIGTRSLHLLTQQVDCRGCNCCS